MNSKDLDTHDHITAVEKVYTHLSRDEDETLARKREEKLARKKGFDNFAQPVAGGSWGSSVDTGIDPYIIDHLFVSEDWVYIAVDTLARQAKLAYPVVKRYVLDADGGEEAEVVPNHPAQTLMESPNPYQTNVGFIYSAAVNFFLQGNVIVWHAKNAGQLWVLPSGRVYPQISPTEGLYSYVFSSDYQMNPHTSVNIPADEVAHLRRENPFSVYWGLSPFIPGRRSTQFNQYAQEYLTSFFQKGATFPVILTHDTAATEEKMIHLLKKFEQAYTGRTNQRRALMLPKGMDAKVVDHKIADTEIFTALDKNRDTILAILGVAKHAVGLQEAGSLGSEEHKAALRYQWAATVYPMLQSFGECLTRIFRSRGLLEQNEYVDWDVSAAESFSESLTRRAESAKALLDAGLTLNEVRAEIFEREPIEGGDISPVLARLARLQTPITPAPTPAEPPAAAAEGEEEKALDKKEAFFLRHKEMLTKAEEKFNSAEAVGMGKLAGRTLKLFGDQVEIALDILEPQKSIKAPFQWTQAQLAELEERFAELGPQWNDDYTEALLETVKSGQDIALSTAFFVDDPDTISALVQEEEGQARTLLSERGIETFKTISNTSANDILDVIAKGVEAQQTVQEISRAIAEKAGTWPSYRTERIARTETLTAVSLGQKVVNDVIAQEFADRDLRKVWVTANDSRVRDSHANLHRTDVAVDEAFQNGLDHPRELGAPASEVIQCRCSYFLATKEEIGG